jgi:hypothetical protein
MQYILREKLITQAGKLGEVSSLYRSESHRFVDAYLGWLEETEKELSELRSPLSILLQAEKSMVSAVPDGYLAEHISAGKSVRKTQRATAAQSLERVSRELYAKIEAIDSTLSDITEKLSHAVAVLGSKEPWMYETLSASQEGINTIWRMLGSTQETVTMYNYFCAVLAPTDKDSLLMEIIQRININSATRIQLPPAREG